MLARGIATLAFALAMGGEYAHAVTYNYLILGGFDVGGYPLIQPFSLTFSYDSTGNPDTQKSVVQFATTGGFSFVDPVGTIVGPQFYPFALFARDPSRNLLFELFLIYTFYDVIPTLHDPLPPYLTHSVAELIRGDETLGVLHGNDPIITFFASTPEPQTYFLLLSGLVGIMVAKWWGGQK